MSTIKTWEERQAEYLKKYPKATVSIEMFMKDELDDYRQAARATPAQPVPDAYVPIHPRTGPLWASTIPSKDCDHPANYELRPVYFSPSPVSDVSAPSPSSVGAAIPEGWKLVPIEPTDAMLHDGKLRAAFDAFDHPDTGMEIEVVNMADVWRDMLAVAPLAEQVRQVCVTMPEDITKDDALWRAGCKAFRLALNEMTGRDGYVVQKTYEALRSHILAAPSIAQDGQKSEGAELPPLPRAYGYLTGCNLDMESSLETAQAVCDLDNAAEMAMREHDPSYADPDWQPAKPEPLFDADQMRSYALDAIRNLAGGKNG